MDAQAAELVGWLRRQAAKRNATWHRNTEAADTIERLAHLVEPSDKQLNRDAFGEPALPGQMTLFSPEAGFTTSSVAEWVAMQTCNQGGTHE